MRSMLPDKDFIHTEMFPLCWNWENMSLNRFVGYIWTYKSCPVKIGMKMMTYFCSISFGLGREYFKYPSQGTFFKPARVDIMSLTLEKNTETGKTAYFITSKIDWVAKRIISQRYNVNWCHSWIMILSITSLQTRWGSHQAECSGVPSTRHRRQQPRMSWASADA